VGDQARDTAFEHGDFLRAVDGGVLDVDHM
jgi:hypothetical protein